MKVKKILLSLGLSALMLASVPLTAVGPATVQAAALPSTTIKQTMSLKKQPVPAKVQNKEDVMTAELLSRLIRYQHSVITRLSKRHRLHVWQQVCPYLPAKDVGKNLKEKYFLRAIIIM